MEHSNKHKSYWPTGLILVFGFVFFVKYGRALKIIKEAAYKQLDTEKQKWLISAIKYNYIMMALVFAINIFPFFYTWKVFKQDRSASKVNIPKLVYQAINDDVKTKELAALMPKELKTAGWLFALSFVVNLLIFLDPALRKSLTLQKFLPSEEGKERVWTPIGVIINTYGSDINSVLSDKRLWTAINISTDKDYVFVHPKTEALAFFTKKIQLKKEYIFR